MGLKTTAPEQGNQQAARWNQELVEFLVPKTPNAADTTVWWIALDGFRQAPSEAIQDFITQLAQRIQGTVRYRLILVDYAYPLPLPVAAFAFKERVQPLRREEVESFLGQVHESKYGAAPAKETLTQYVAGVYDQLAEYKRDYPESADDQLLLNMAVSDAAAVIQG